MVERLGIEPETANWEPRSIYFYMARGVHHGPDGSFSSTNLAMSSLVQRIYKVNDEVRKGTHSTNRENDVSPKHSETRSTMVALEEPVLFLGK